ncbi:MAG: hypothetical protein IKR04_02395, partial [Clostridia bacterium]|nr:hypothetical protein [Clostridia bacterium]
MKKIFIFLFIIILIEGAFSISYAASSGSVGRAGLASDRSVGTCVVWSKWYYGVPNASGSALTTNIKMWGPTARSNMSKYLTFTDSIPANTLRLYLFDTFTNVNSSSYERSALAYMDFELSSDTVGNVKTNPTTLAHTTMTATSNDNLSSMTTSMSDYGEYHFAHYWRPYASSKTKAALCTGSWVNYYYFLSTEASDSGYAKPKFKNSLTGFATDLCGSDQADSLSVKEDTLYNCTQNLSVSEENFGTKNLKWYTLASGVSATVGGYGSSPDTGSDDLGNCVITYTDHVHSYSWTWDDANYPGKHWKVCSCGDWNTYEDHSYTSSVTTEPTCTSAGVKTYTCTCGRSYTEAIAALGHNGGAAATCTTAQTCTRCGAIIVAALGHDWATAWTTDDNNHWHKCTRCTATSGTEAHSWGSGTITTSPTCTATGVRTYTCSVCSKTKTATEAALGHNPGTAATCTTAQTCTRCGTVIVNALGHDWGDWTRVTNPTCTTKGQDKRVCRRDSSHVETRDVAALGHNWDTAWTTDGSNHWHKCLNGCGEKNSNGAHSDTSSPKNGLCNTCEYRMYYIATLATYSDKTYNAESQSISASTGYTLSGTTSATNVGTYTATATLSTHSDGKPYRWATDAATGTKTVTWKIVPYNLSNATIASISAYTYDTTAKKPTPTVTVPIPSGSTTTLTNGTHFTYSYSNNTNAGTAIVTITAIANTNYTGSKSATFTINKYNLSNATIGNISTYTYGGDEKKPTPTITVPIPSGSTTTIGTANDFTFSYSNNINAGTATCTITGKGNYTGTKSKNFTINKATTAIAMNPGTTSVIKDTFGYSLGEAHAKVSYGASKSMTAT